jgi:hypothetical protein
MRLGGLTLMTVSRQLYNIHITSFSSIKKNLGHFLRKIRRFFSQISEYTDIM